MLENFLREYNINRILLLTTGLWPYQNKLVRSLIWMFCFLVQISYYPFEVLLLYDHSNDVQLIFEGCYQICILTIFLIRYVSYFLHSDKIRWLYKAIDEHWNTFTDDIEIQIMKEYSMLSRKFVICYSILFFSSLLIITIVPLTPIFLDILMPLNESRPRFFAVEVEFRVNKDEYFLPIFCYTTIVIVVGTFIALGFDAMHIACAAHACSLFAAVSKQIEYIMLKVDNNSNDIKENNVIKRLDLSSEKMIYREYIICLKKHQIAIKFVDVLNSTYQECALILLIVLLAVLSLSGLRIIYVLDRLGELIKFVLVLITALLALLIPCYSGQRIMDESQNISYGAYAAQWYKFSRRLKSLSVITLYRSNKPCGLKAGNIIPLSIATYATVIRMSMSYYTAILSIQD